MKFAHWNKLALRGFTLIELMIVVAIIGILAAIALPQYSHYTSRSRASGAAAELASLRMAVSECYQLEGKFDNCTAMGVGNIPTVNTTPFIASTPTLNGSGQIIVASTGATTSAGVPLAYTLTPSTTSGQASMDWSAGSSTICDPVRGLKSGQGGC